MTLSFLSHRFDEGRDTISEIWRILNIQKVEFHQNRKSRKSSCCKIKNSCSIQERLSSNVFDRVKSDIYEECFLQWPRKSSIEDALQVLKIFLMTRWCSKTMLSELSFKVQFLSSELLYIWPIYTWLCPLECWTSFTKCYLDLCKNCD